MLWVQIIFTQTPFLVIQVLENLKCLTVLNQIKDINGRALMRMNDEKLQIIGIENSSHRYEILKEIYKQVFIIILLKLFEFL